MPYQATVFNVLIASPSDVYSARGVAREVIYDWNASHSQSSNLIFHPIGWETHSHPAMGERAQSILNKQILDDSDLLIGIFWTRIGTPTGEAAGGSVEEIQRHVKANKPAMVYFSEEPVRLDSVDTEQYQKLLGFKEECTTNGLIEKYDSLADFRHKLSRHLASIVNKSPHFKVHQATTSPAMFDVPDPPRREVPTLSGEAEALLVAASDDRHGTIIHVQYIGGMEISTNNKQFVEQGNDKSRALWEGALKELERLDFVEAQGHRREIYRLTSQGYRAAELFKG